MPRAPDADEQQLLVRDHREDTLVQVRVRVRVGGVGVGLGVGLGLGLGLGVGVGVGVGLGLGVGVGVARLTLYRSSVSWESTIARACRDHLGR